MLLYVYKVIFFFFEKYKVIFAFFEMETFQLNK